MMSVTYREIIKHYLPLRLGKEPSLTPDSLMHALLMQEDQFKRVEKGKRLAVNDIVKYKKKDSFVTWYARVVRMWDCSYGITLVSFKIISFELGKSTKRKIMVRATLKDQVGEIWEDLEETLNPVSKKLGKKLSTIEAFSSL